MRRYTIPASIEVEYILTDHLGSTSITTDATGKKVSQTKYYAVSRRDKPWGEIRGDPWTDEETTAAMTDLPFEPIKRTFTGQYSYVGDFGLHFYNARWYDSSIGRFVQADTIVPGGFQGLDRYAYVNNNPVMFTDPTGHYSCEGLSTYAKTACEDSQKTIDDRLAEYGVTLTGNMGEWTAARKVAALIAVMLDGMTDRQDGQSSQDAFKARHPNGVNLHWGCEANCRAADARKIITKTKWVKGKEITYTVDGGPCDDYTSDGCRPGGAFTAGNTIYFAGLSRDPVKNIIHELGHIVYHKYAENDPEADSNINRDFLLPNPCDRCYVWQQHPFPMLNYDADSEEFADMYIAWVYGAWNAPKEADNVIQWMNTIIP